MYVLLCPCIRNPALRAKGITTPDDLTLFKRCIEHCEKFGIEMVLLPCPETMFLGPARKPGTFLERLNTPAFVRVLDKLEKEVQEIIVQKGPPLCILGVNSSPTCGVSSTYYGSTGDLPPKREGRGVFLARFPDIKAVDVNVFACFRIYLAAPLFSEAEQEYNRSIARLLAANFYEVYLPQDIGDTHAGRSVDEHRRIFEQNKKALEYADAVVAIIDGADADSGTSWEMGYAAARGKQVIAIRTDFRTIGHSELVNLMLEQSSVVVKSKDELLAELGFSIAEGSERQ